MARLFFIGVSHVCIFPPRTVPPAHQRQRPTTFPHGCAHPPKDTRGAPQWPPGTTCVIFASGPSLTEQQAQHVAQAHTAGRCHAIAVNDTWMLAPWADCLYACDLRWWAKRAPSDARFPGLRLTQDATAAERHGAIYVRSETGVGLCREPMVINQGLNSGYQALNLAFHLGASRVLLLGYDMQVQASKTHFFGDYPAGSGLQVPSPYRDFVARFGPLARDLAAVGVEVVNCSTETALDCFTRGNIFTEL